MKKSLILVLFIFTFYFLSAQVIAKNIYVPKDAIRIRIIANSDSTEDQNLKLKVKNVVTSYINKKIKGVNDSEKAYKIIENNIDNISKKVNKVIKEEGFSEYYKIDYGYNYFPKKIYGGVTYKEGYYKSLVITLGEGRGKNWWCVLFPPLCLVDNDKGDDVQYKSIVKEIIKKIK